MRRPGVRETPGRRPYTTRSFPPSIGTCAPVVQANVSEHISATSRPTAALVISAPSRLRRLYASALNP